MDAITNNVFNGKNPRKVSQQQKQCVTLCAGAQHAEGPALIEGGAKASRAG